MRVGRGRTPPPRLPHDAPRQRRCLPVPRPPRPRPPASAPSPPPPPLPTPHAVHPGAHPAPSTMRGGTAGGVGGCRGKRDRAPHRQRCPRHLPPPTLPPPPRAVPLSHLPADTSPLSPAYPMSARLGSRRGFPPPGGRSLPPATATCHARLQGGGRGRDGFAPHGAPPLRTSGTNTREGEGEGGLVRPSHSQWSSTTGSHLEAASPRDWAGR